MLRSHETRVSYISQEHQEEQGTCCYVELLSDTEPKDDSDNEDDGILNAFTATVNPTGGIVEKEELVDSKFEKMDDQDDIYTIYEKL